MKKNVITAALLVLLGLSGISAQSAGGGISVFVPETLYRYGQGTIAFEQGFSTSVGIGSSLSVPLGFAYHSSDGYLLSHDELGDVQLPVLYGDSILPYAGLQARIPLGQTFYIEAFAGGLLHWAFSLNPTGLGMSQALASSPTEYVAIESLKIDRKLGYGWLAGGAFGVRIGAISVDLGATYRAIVNPVDISGTIHRVNGGTATDEPLALTDARAILRGISFRIGGSYQL
ncbi:MAG: hypothetical protein AB7T74_16660 [Clostridia bacterium]